MTIQIDRTDHKRKKIIFLAISVISSLAVLFFYKYYNFFGNSFNQIFSFIDVSIRAPYLNILLPVGISFYTFQTLSYSIDVYNGKMKPEMHLGIYALYVSFFPQLVAGPIERSTRLLPQFREHYKISIDNFIVGAKYMIIGFFMKLVIADRLAIYVDSVYNNVEQHTGSTLLLASFMFAFQIFGDFAGYSSIAIGVAKIMGYDLMINFKRPYFATSIGDFWHRWHISLSTWFRDYFYIPLGGSRVKISRWYLNLFLTFLVSGLWHGANWTFVIWGALHGIYIVLENVFNLGVKKNKSISFIERVFRIIVVFILVDFAWIFFRANSVTDAFYIVDKIINFQGELFIDSRILFYGFIGLATLLINDVLIEINKQKSFIEDSSIGYKPMFYFTFLIMLLLTIGVFNGGQFIYFQF